MKIKIKKIIILLLIISVNLFSYYSSDTMIDLLVQSNQLRIRTDRFGALFGNENIRAAIGLTGANALSGIILHNVSSFDNLNDAKKGLDKFVPAVLGAIGYKMPIFGIALGYEYKWISHTYMVHTPILSMNALDDNFRINIPISVGVGQKSYYNKDSFKGTLVISTGIEGRYYFNNPIFSHLRFYFNYGNSTIKEINSPATNFTQQSVGFQLRAYFNYDMPYNMKLTPIIRFQFDTALATKFNNMKRSVNLVDNYFITAKGFTPVGDAVTEGAYGSTGANPNVETGGELRGGYVASIPNTYYAEEPYRIGVAFPLGFSAMSESKTIEFYLEPALSFTIVNAKKIYSFTMAQQGLENLTEADIRKTPFYTFGYVVYGELYIRPIPQLEWYTELQTGGATVAGELASTSGIQTSIIFNASTGITWYF